MVKNGVYRHFKGGEVLVFGIAKTPEDGVDVLYLGMQNGKIYSRPIESFLDEAKNSDGAIVNRFVLEKEITNIDLVNFLEGFKNN